MNKSFQRKKVIKIAERKYKGTKEVKESHKKEPEGRERKR